MRQRTRTIALVAGGLLAGLACGDGMRVLGDAMVEAGTMLSDAGDAMRPDAQAQPMIVTAECDVTEGTILFAEADVSIDPATVRHVSAIMCDREGDFFGSGGLPCAAGTPRFSGTRIRQQCGGGDPTETGFRYRTVRFVIE